MNEEKSLEEKAAEVIHSGNDIKELLSYYNFYSHSKIWDIPSAATPKEWPQLCLKRAKEELVRRGILTTVDFEKLPQMPDFSPAPGLIVRVNSEENKFDFIRNEYDMEADLHRSADIKKLVADDDAAVNLYRSLCNVEWYKDDIRWSCSWRYAGGIVADLRGKGEDYMDFYCSGWEGQVDPKIEESIRKLGWIPKPC